MYIAYINYEPETPQTTILSKPELANILNEKYFDILNNHKKLLINEKYFVQMPFFQYRGFSNKDKALIGKFFTQNFDPETDSIIKKCSLDNDFSGDHVIITDNCIKIYNPKYTHLQRQAYITFTVKQYNEILDPYLLNSNLSIDCSINELLVFMENLKIKMDASDPSSGFYLKTYTSGEISLFYEHNLYATLKHTGGWVLHPSKSLIKNELF